MNFKFFSVALCLIIIGKTEPTEFNSTFQNSQNDFAAITLVGSLACSWAIYKCLYKNEMINNKTNKKLLNRALARKKVGARAQLKRNCSTSKQRLSYKH